MYIVVPRYSFIIEGQHSEDTWTITRRRISEAPAEGESLDYRQGIAPRPWLLPWVRVAGSPTGWRERQSSLLDEFFLFSRRSFKNGRLACKLALARASSIYFDYFFLTPVTSPQPRVRSGNGSLPSDRLSLIHVFPCRSPFGCVRIHCIVFLCLRRGHLSLKSSMDLVSNERVNGVKFCSKGRSQP